MHDPNLTAFRFLDLPAEIRNLVYDYIADDESTIKSIGCSAISRFACVPLLKTCSRVCDGLACALIRRLLTSISRDLNDFLPVPDNYFLVQQPGDLEDEESAFTHELQLVDVFVNDVRAAVERDANNITHDTGIFIAWGLRGSRFDRWDCIEPQYKSETWIQYLIVTDSSRPGGRETSLQRIFSHADQEAAR
ncbi:MAG: hypothetical protein M1820_010384 [Bogoriella megaspora]|nr:MAG: hypothetical protein M1820_010384 [Bogoriella megaspora]